MFKSQKIKGTFVEYSKHLERKSKLDPIRNICTYDSRFLYLLPSTQENPISFLGGHGGEEVHFQIS
jgi:hypothetical protein